jgi:serine protease Do
MKALRGAGAGRAVGLVALGTILMLGAPATGAGTPMPESLAPLIDRVKPAVVTIATTELRASSDDETVPRAPSGPRGSPLEKFFHDHLGRKKPKPVERLTALGSGFIIDATGLVVTNNHVVANGTDIRVTLADGTDLPATLLGHDEQTDLAVLKVEAGHPLPTVAFGDSDGAKVGDWVVAVGNPFGLGGTVTAGIISARERDIHSGPADDYLQIDAAINQGNSGGPTFNLNGQVIGINTAIFSPNGGSVGIGFAIPANLAKPVIAQLRSAGKVTRSWLGVQIQSITPELADAFGLPHPKGALVADIAAKSPAAVAGLQIGDVILAHDGKPVGELRELTNAIAASPVGKQVRLTIARDGKTSELPVTLAELKQDDTPPPGPVAKEAAPASGANGLKLAALTAAQRIRFGIAGEVQGVLITGVAESSAAADLGLQPGDIIEQVNGRKVGTPKEVGAAIAGAGKSGRKSVALLVNRQGDKEFVALPLANG